MAVAVRAEPAARLPAVLGALSGVHAATCVQVAANRSLAAVSRQTNWCCHSTDLVALTTFEALSRPERLTTDQKVGGSNPPGRATPPNSAREAMAHVGAGHTRNVSRPPIGGAGRG